MQEQFLKQDGALMILRRMVEDKLQTMDEKFDHYAQEAAIKEWTRK